jgi:hypothetical protein
MMYEADSHALRGIWSLLMLYPACALVSEHDYGNHDASS